LSAYDLHLGDTRIFGISQIPCVLLGRIGIDDKYRGHDLTKKFILKYSMGICNIITSNIGCRLLLMEIELHDPFRKYCIKNGFKEIKSNRKYHFIIRDLLD